jgi:hypothetical protein
VSNLEPLLALSALRELNIEGCSAITDIPDDLIRKPGLAIAGP